MKRITSLSVARTLLFCLSPFLIAWCLVLRVTNISGFEWQEYSSQTEGFAFQYPIGWSVINKDVPYVILCPPEEERVSTRFLYGNCIWLYVNEHLYASVSDEYKENVVRVAFPLQASRSGDYRDFRDMKEGAFGGMVGLFSKDRSRKIGLNQPVCPSGGEVECKVIFKHVLKTLKFID